jgi:hypothetical protein
MSPDKYEKLIDLVAGLNLPAKHLAALSRDLGALRVGSNIIGWMAYYFELRFQEKGIVMKVQAPEPPTGKKSGKI